jgi:enoyl-CoA hydratase/carnithine racemase
MSTDNIKLSIKDGIAEIEINRPEKKNALTQAMYTGLAEAFSRADADPLVRVVVIRGQSNVFTSGNDLKDFINFDTSVPFESGPIYRFMCAIASMAKPVIAAVNGVAVGIGTTLLLHCDIVLAADNTMFQMPFVNLGLCPEAASSLLLPRLAGYQRAANLLLLGEPFSAQHAKEVGLVNEVLPEADVLTRALGRARQLAAQPASAVRLTKRLLKEADAATVLRVMLEEGRQFRERLESGEAKEAFAAFMEKRKADFSRFA